MNELIAKLIQEATESNPSGYDGGFLTFNKEKFAELIVKETMRVVANRLPSNVYLDVAEAVIEHFGDK